MTKHLGLLLAFVAWFIRLSLLSESFVASHEGLAPSTAQLLASGLSLCAIWLVTLSRVIQLPHLEARLLSFWLIADIMFIFAPQNKLFFFLGVLFYAIAHLTFAWQVAPKGRISFKITIVICAALVWAAILLTGAHGSTLLYVVTFLYAQLLIMFVAFAVANALLKSFGNWAHNALAAGALLFLAGDLTIAIGLFNPTALKLLALDRINFDLTSLLFGTSQLLLVVAAYLSRKEHDEDPPIIIIISSGVQ